MYRLITILCVALLLGACTEIAYKEPQPKGMRALAEVPAKLQGRYQIMEENEVVDTLVIHANGYQLGQDEVAALSDSLILKQYKGYYFLSIREDLAWYLRVMRQQKNGDLIFMEMQDFPDGDEARKVYIDKLTAVVPVVTTETDNKTYYVIDPEPKKLLEMIRKGFFREQTFKRIR
jgi:hypothetical protein